MWIYVPMMLVAGVIILRLERLYDDSVIHEQLLSADSVVSSDKNDGGCRCGWRGAVLARHTTRSLIC